MKAKEAASTIFIDLHDFTKREYRLIPGYGFSEEYINIDYLCDLLESRRGKNLSFENPFNAIAAKEDEVILSLIRDLS